MKETTSRIPRISVTIATFRRRDLLERVIYALENQTIARDQYEVIVCDSVSGDGTREMMSSLMADFPNLVYIDLDVNTLAAKRNAGLRQARADLVIFLDDDAIPSPGFVVAHLAAHKDGISQFVCGNVRFPADWIARSNYFHFRDSRHLGPSRPEIDPNDIPYHMIVVMNGSFRREDILNRVGVVNEEFQRYGGEDYEFGYRVARAGLKIRFAPDAVVEHYEHGGSIRQYMKKLYITSRDSLPVLYRLAPGSRETALSWLLETPTTEDRWRHRWAQIMIRLALQRGIVNAVERLLESTDRVGWCYWPVLFRYAFAGAMLRGIRDRERAQAQLSSNGSLAQQAGNGGRWFE